MTVDARTGEMTNAFAYAPATLRLSEVTRFNFNGGWTWDRDLNRNLATYGVGFDWKMTSILILTLETFGQYTDGPNGPTTRPRFQGGLRFRPVDTLSFDVIYGRNINGEDANWITFATTVRFPPKAVRSRCPSKAKSPRQVGAAEGFVPTRSVAGRQGQHDNEPPVTYSNFLGLRPLKAAASWI